MRIPASLVLLASLFLAAVTPTIPSTCASGLHTSTFAAPFVGSHNIQPLDSISEDHLCTFGNARLHSFHWITACSSTPRSPKRHRASCSVPAARRSFFWPSTCVSRLKPKLFAVSSVRSSRSTFVSTSATTSSRMSAGIALALRPAENEPLNKSRNEGGLNKNSLDFIAPGTVPLKADVDTVKDTPGDLDTSSCCSGVASDRTNATSQADAFSTTKYFPSLPREALRFDFVGLSIWLELEERDDDISNAITDYAEEKGLLPIPQGHVTALYGMEHIDVDEARRKFVTEVTPARFSSWPGLKPIGVLVDVEVEGVNGGTMDMAWSEITLSSSREHEEYLDMLHNIFYAPTSSEHEQRTTPWRPHLSIAYDNPEDPALCLTSMAQLIARHPSLIQSKPRNITGIALWSTQGKMTDWKCLERMSF